jgi:hypothetical protein
VDRIAVPPCSISKGERWNTERSTRRKIGLGAHNTPDWLSRAHCRFPELQGLQEYTPEKLNVHKNSARGLAVMAKVLESVPK